MSASATRQQKKGGCGCNGGTAVPHKCSCDKPGCDACETRGFVRPRFFAGQLLTEDDLAALGDYVVGKDRLHNRHFFGDGVVCGLDVAVHPCGEGRLIVQPGYALDCCGNDIVVPCAKTLDVNAMVRELQLNTLGGFDCGDPCEDKKTAKKTARNASSAPAGIAIHVPPSAPGVPPTPAPEPERLDLPIREYCLYVRYCETETDPVSPYATGDPCGARSCEPTRVQEGFRFELRCRPKETPPDDIVSRLCECFDDGKPGADKSAVSSFHQTYAMQLKSGAAALESPPPPDPEQLRIAAANLKTLLADRQPTPEWARTNIDELLERSRLVEMHLSRLFVAEGKKTTNKPALEALSAAKETFELESVKAALADKPEVEREYANAVVANMEHLRGTGRFTAELNEHKLLAGGMVASQPLHRKIGESIVASRDVLLRRVEARPDLREPTLERNLSMLAVEPEAASQRAFTNPGAIRTIAKSIDVLKKSADQTLIDCVCKQMNPPCSKCTDLSVLIACVQVQDCEIIKVCALDRKWVLNFVSLRYWFPLIGMVGHAIHDFCCPPPDCGEDEKPHGSPITQKMMQSLVLLYWLLLKERCLPDMFMKSSAGGALGISGVSRDDAIFAALSGDPATADATVMRMFSTVMTPAAPAAPAVPPEVTNELGELRRMVKALQDKVGP